MARKYNRIRQRHDGLWEARLPAAWINGKYVRRSLYNRDRAELERELREALRARDRGLPCPMHKQTLMNFLDSWLGSVRANVKERTFEQYESVCRLHAIPLLGTTPLTKLHQNHFRRLFTEKLAAGLSAQSVLHIKRILHNALSQAVEDGLIASNPITRTVKTPTVRRPPVNPLRPEEARAFIAAAEQTRLGALLNLLLVMGLRRSEGLGLRWADISLEQRILCVNQTAQLLRAKVARDGKAGFVFAAPKTEQSARRLEIPELLIPILRKHRARQAEERLIAGSRWTDHDLVFANRTGGPVRPDQVSEEFHATARRARIDRKLTVHQLRHACASLLISEGVQLKTVASVLGHSTVVLTSNVYGHLYPEAKREAAAKINALLTAND